MLPREPNPAACLLACKMMLWPPLGDVWLLRPSVARAGHVGERPRAGVIILESILKNFFTPPQPRVTASVAHLDMVLQCALEPYPPARPGHRTHLAHHFRRLHPLVRRSHVLRLSPSMIQRVWRNACLSDMLRAL